LTSFEGLTSVNTSVEPRKRILLKEKLTFKINLNLKKPWLVGQRLFG
jgi:hypothetical protein